jgi:predicted dehydrogenase
MEPIRVGVVGAGLSATVFHLPFLTSSTAFSVRKVLRSTAREIPGYRHLEVTDNPDAFFSTEDLDLVVVTAPSHQHYRLAARALKSGLHVVLEKPMCVTYAEAKELCQLAEQTNKIIAVYHNRRWDGDFLTVQSIVKEGVLGRVVEYESHFDRFRNSLKPGWKEEDHPGSGVLYDLGMPG